MRPSLNLPALGYFARPLLILGPLLSCVFAPACPKPVVGNSSAVVVLLDYSRSFAPYSASDVAALNEAYRSILQMVKVGSLPQPVKILWAAFGDDGLRPLEPCGPPLVFSQSLTGRTSSQIPSRAPVPKRLTRIEDLESWLSECVIVVRATSQSAQRFTDISGALTFAADAVEDITDERVVILCTDLLEDLPPDRRPPTFRLSRAKVLLIWRPGLDDQEDPAAAPRRVDGWRKKLEAAGASRVCAKAAEGLTEGEIASCLWK